MDNEKALDSIEKAIDFSYAKHYNRIKKELAAQYWELNFLNMILGKQADHYDRNMITYQILRTEIIIETLEKLLGDEETK